MIETDQIKEELDNVLRDVAESLKITNYDLLPDLKMNFGDGFVSLFYTGQVKDKNTGDIVNVAIKMAPKHPGFEYKDIFRHEEKFYIKIFPTLDALQKECQSPHLFNNVAKYLCSKIEPETYIAMENLKSIGYKLHDKMQYLNEEHLDFIFKVYAKFHAISFVLKKRNLEKYNELTGELPNIFEKLCDLFLSSIEDPIRATINLLNGEAYDKTKKVLDNIREIFLKSCVYTGPYNCITHGDCWSNNMLFKYSDDGKLEDLKLIDFQLVANGSPIQDLSYFLYSGGSKKDFDNLERYLNLYHKHFSESCKELGYSADELYPLDQLKKEWKEHAILGIFMGVFLWTVKLQPKEKFQELIENKGLNTEEKEQVWKTMQEEMHLNPDFQEKIKVLVFHAVDYGIFK